MHSHRGKLILAGLVGALAATLITSSWPLDKATADHHKKAGKHAKGQAVEKQSISLEQAHHAIVAAKEKAEEMELKMNIAVVDVGTNLKGFARMDGAWLGSIDIAIKKAKTSRLFDMPTGKIGELSQPGKSLYQIEVSNDGLITFPGGVPIKAPNGQVIGAIGVSGSTVNNDHQVATAGAQAVMNAMKKSGKKKN